MNQQAIPRNQTISEMRTEIDHLEIWASINSYFLPFIFCLMAFAIALSTVGSVLTGEPLDATTVVFRLLSFIPIVAGILLVRNQGKAQKKRAEVLKKELMASLQSHRGQSLLKDLTLRNASFTGEMGRLVRLVFLGPRLTRRILLVLLLGSATVAVVWVFIFLFMWNLSVGLVLILFLPMICLLSFLLVLYWLAR